MNPRIVQEIRSLQTITPQTVRDYAVEHPLSAIAEWLNSQGAWDTEQAAANWVLHLCSTLIRKVRVVIETPNGDAVRVRAFVSLGSDRVSGGGYRDIHHVLETPSLRSIMVQDALVELNRVRNQYRLVHELAQIWAEIEAHTAAGNGGQ